MNTRINLLGFYVFLLTTAVFLHRSLKASESDENPSMPAIVQVYTPAETAQFKALATATLDNLSSGNKTDMITKLTDLETVWDDNENSLKPRSEPTWTAIDKTLDKAITSLRSSKYDEKKGATALKLMQDELDQATKK